jgi:hypothetical protein
VDLTGLRYNISYAEALELNWWTDPTMRAAFKSLLTDLLSRKNSQPLLCFLLRDDSQGETSIEWSHLRTRRYPSGLGDRKR